MIIDATQAREIALKANDNVQNNAILRSILSNIEKKSNNGLFSYVDERIFDSSTVKFIEEKLVLLQFQILIDSSNMGSTIEVRW